jgi:peptidyl-prolyl cis-trans isomerase B (cyclophilin B)
MLKSFVLAVAGLALLAGCGSSAKSSVSSENPSTSSSVGSNGDAVTSPGTSTTPPCPEAPKGSQPTASIATNVGCIVVELDTAHAPKAAGRFISLAKSGFYNGLTFHRAVPNFVIQGGDPTGTGSGGSGKPPVVGEVPTDGYPLGSLAAAKTQTDPDGTFDCQFFIVTGEQGTQLPNQYARFGKVVAGMDVATKIESFAPPQGDGPPTQKVTMEKVTITGA